MERVGRLTIGICFAAFGVLYLIYRDFVTSIVPKPPSWVPWHPFWVILTGLALIAGGAGIALEERRFAWANGCGCVATLVLLHLPAVLAAPLARGANLVSPGEDLAYAGTAFLVAALLNPKPVSPTRDWQVRFFKYALAAFMILCGWLHVVMTAYVASLIPSWIPSHLFWTYFAAVALIAGGVGIIIPQTARWASLLSGVMILAWVPLVHLRLALHNLHDPGQLASSFEALAFGAGLLLLYRRGGPKSPDPAFSSRQSLTNAQLVYPDRLTERQIG